MTGYYFYKHLNNNQNNQRKVYYIYWGIMLTSISRCATHYNTFEHFQSGILYWVVFFKKKFNDNFFKSITYKINQLYILFYLVLDVSQWCFKHPCLYICHPRYRNSFHEHLPEDVDRPSPRNFLFNLRILL